MSAHTHMGSIDQYTKDLNQHLLVILYTWYLQMNLFLYSHFRTHFLTMYLFQFCGLE